MITRFKWHIRLAIIAIYVIAALGLIKVVKEANDPLADRIPVHIEKGVLP